MDRNQKTTFLILSLIGLIYFTVFIFPNLTGARDATMLSVFQHDEFAQYPHVLRMLTPGETPYQSLRNFVVYQHYYYGYPFYFFSALAILPVRLVLGSGWAANTPVIVMVLRQAVSALPMILAALLLVWVQTQFRSRLRAILLFLLMLSLPAVVSNNMWWHPDSLLVLFSVLTIFFLVRDDFRFGRNFYFSAVAVGLAFGVKILGVLFVLAYAVYIVYGLIQRRATLKHALLRSGLFVGLMLLTVVVSNPLLLLPQERSEIITAFTQLLRENTLGFWVVGNSGGGIFSQVAEIFRGDLGSAVLLLAGMIALIFSLFIPLKRTAAMVVLSWTVGYAGYFLLFASTMRTHYLLPVALPVISFLAVLIPDTPNARKKLVTERAAAAWRRTVLLILVILFLNIRSGVEIVRGVLNRERDSASIQLYLRAEPGVLSQIELERKLWIYRDWRAYVAEKDAYHIEYRWQLADYSYIRELNADVLFLERENMVYFSDAAKIDAAIDPGRMREMVVFYGDAIKGQVEGYTLAYKTGFGSVFVRDDMFEQYLDCGCTP
jgi:hypothetical protein